MLIFGYNPWIGIQKAPLKILIVNWEFRSITNIFDLESGRFPGDFEFIDRLAPVCCTVYPKNHQDTRNNFCMQ